jgi:hypothetical protein
VEDVIITKWSGKYCTIDDISSSIIAVYSNISRKTIIWKVNQLIKEEKIVRVGRGVYLVAYKKKFRQAVSIAAKQACNIIENSLKYLDITLTDTSSIGELMVLQPFSSIINLEVKKTAVSSVVSTLRKEKIPAYRKNDYPQLERYLESNQPILVRPVLSVNPAMPKENNVKFAIIEKILVDLVCDTDIYGQYQDIELYNIYRNATELYAINYSQILKYASARGKKDDVVDYLQETSEYMKVRSLL